MLLCVEMGSLLSLIGIGSFYGSCFQWSFNPRTVTAISNEYCPYNLSETQYPGVTIATF
jgi:hypothetical protein